MHGIKRDGKFCRIHGGIDSEIFKIIRENEYLIVVEIPVGCIFTGDFLHAGVRNFSSNTPQDALMKDFNDKIAAITTMFPPHERVLRGKATLDMMCSFRGLSRLCRLHCSTEMLEGPQICVPPNAIGFTECLPNPPDKKCFQTDDVTSESGSSNESGYAGVNGDKNEPDESESSIDNQNRQAIQSTHHSNSSPSESGPHIPQRRNNYCQVEI